MKTKHLYRVVTVAAGEPGRTETIQLLNGSGCLEDFTLDVPDTLGVVYRIQCRVCGEDAFGNRGAFFWDTKEEAGLKLLEMDTKYEVFHDQHVQCAVEAEAEAEAFRQGRIK